MSRSKHSNRDSFVRDDEAKDHFSFARLVSDITTGGFIKRYDLGKYYIYIITIVAGMILYIANTFHTQKLYRREAILKEQVKELRAKSLTIASIKMTATRQSTIIAEIERRQLPLVQPTNPPMVVNTTDADSIPSEQILITHKPFSDARQRE